MSPTCGLQRQRLRLFTKTQQHLYLRSMYWLLMQSHQRSGLPSEQTPSPSSRRRTPNRSAITIFTAPNDENAPIVCLFTPSLPKLLDHNAGHRHGSNLIHTRAHNLGACNEPLAAGWRRRGRSRCIQGADPTALHLFPMATTTAACRRLSK